MLGMLRGLVGIYASVAVIVIVIAIGIGVLGEGILECAV